ncbi:gcvT, partial [Symbiodinium sp. KB8]
MNVVVIAVTVTSWHGKDRVEFLERVLVGDIAGLDKGKATLSVITNENGGIVDDTVVTNMGDYVNMVVNGATKYKDMKHFDNVLQEFKSAGKDVGYEYFHERQLIALQGPAAARVLARHVEDPSVLPKLGFMESTPLKVAGIKDAVVTRCGYTGEDGFEISLPWNEAEKAARAFLAEEEVLEAGLGARDSLRLEAGLCLYGHDIDETTSPVEAALNWTIGKRRREDGRFIGADKILPQLKKGGVSRKRVGLIIDGPPAR